ncbi:hypothetical protein J8N05_34665 [Streptomyces sp. BH-SS-21]|uniref:Membrane-bound hydrophilic protein n=1 Tax=Streptomyces liliiviolaceus TaxID=2823109 RepID=A0A940Y0W1_9ACTN|nr:hypothetical protein [Streptomyces liliiviolaceus]MBQ0853310.1 hypothetical protein [Streptomyces liliiviolaceus]
MPADEVHYADSAGESRERTGPRHAAPRKPLFTRLHVPAGKAIAIASMPTAILMGMGFTPTLAQADDKPSAKNLTIDEYKDCVEALDDSAKDAKDDKADEEKDTTATPSPSASTSAPASDDDSAGDGSTGDGSSSDSGSEDKPEPTPSASASKPAGSGGGASTPTPTPSQSSGNVLDEIGDALEDILTPGGKETATPTAEPSATPSASATKGASDAADDVEDTVKDTAGKAEDTAKDVTDKASEAAKDAKDELEDAADEATASATPSPSASSTTDPDDCPAATDDESGVEQGIPALADDPWMLEASSLTLKGADYKGIVKVKTANGSVKKVLKYVISNGTDIGDLHQTVDDKDAGVRYHVQAGSGTTSTIKDGKTVMYTESISGNLLGLIPITFDPENPPPLNIPLIYFTKVKVVQAAQFGGDLTIPGMRQYNTPLG